MITDAIVQQLQMSNFVFRANVGDMTFEESLARPEPGGNCLNWVLGHTVAVRCDLLRGLGGEAFWDEADCKRYARHEPGITRAEDARPLAELWAGLDETFKNLESAIAKLTPEKLAEEASFIQEDAPGGTFETALAAFAFHDAYHAGQTGVLRRVIGKGPADL